MTSERVKDDCVILKEAAKNGALDLLEALIEDFTKYGSARSKQEYITISKEQLLLQLNCWKNNINQGLWEAQYV